MSETSADGVDRNEHAPAAGTSVSSVTSGTSASTSPTATAPVDNTETATRWQHLHNVNVHTLHRLPGADEDDPFARLAAAWLLTLTSAHTTRAYAIEATTYSRWCSRHDIHPLQAERWHLDAYRHWLASAPTRTGRPRAAANISRALSALAGLYSHGVTLGVLTRSPVADVRRPRVAPESQSIALSAAELRAVMHAAEKHSPRAAALTSVLMLTGIRIGEALAADVADLGTDAGHRVLQITRKGGKRARVVLPAATVRALQTHLSGRTSGPLFCNAAESAAGSSPGGCGVFPAVGALQAPSTTSHEGHSAAAAPAVDAAGLPRGAEQNLQRWQYGPASRLLTQLFTAAGVSSRATAHSFRHSWVTEFLNLGVPLQDVQDAAGHADPRTTRRYHRSRDHLDRSPNDRLATALLGGLLLPTEQPPS